VALDTPSPATPTSDEDRRRGRWRAYALPTAAAAAAVALVLSVVALATSGGDDHTTRVVERAPEIVSSKGAAIDARAIYRRDAPGVAFVQSSGITTSTPSGQARETATGSGFVLDRRGDILTNAHVVDGARRVTVRFGHTGGEIPARVVGTDNSKDLAVLRVDPSAVALHPLALGNSARVRVGDPVAAIGNPFGFDRTITTGIVSALQRQISAPDGFAIEHVIQTDAAINPGNSGGPLINARGQVIGINSQIATGGNGDANVGIGFAIPIETAKRELRTLEGGGTVRHAFLGVQVGAARNGALVHLVESGSPAAKAGVRRGDVIVSLAGKRVEDPDALVQAVGARAPGQTVSLVYLRNGARHTTRVQLAAQPSQASPAGSRELPAP
jgi:putative serine protease PepD